MKKFLKIGFFYFVAFSMVLGNSIVNIDFSTSLAHAEESEISIVADSLESEPSCEGADIELPVDLYVVGSNCDSGLPSYDSEVVNLASGGNYDVYTVAHRDALNEDATYGQDNEEFTIRVNSSLEGPVVLDQPDGMVWNIQNAGNFDFVSGDNTVHMDTAFDCIEAGDPMARNSVTVTKLCLYEVEDDKPYCGDGVVNQEVEQCDGDEAQSCITEAGYTGTQTCNMPSDGPTLQSTEPTYCVWNSCLTEEYCGDGIQNGNEQCDDGSNGSDTCTAECTLIEEEEECLVENNLFVNGSFEEPVVTNSDLWQRMNSVLGWIIERVSDDLLTTLELHRGWSGNIASHGLQYSELDGDHSTRVTQNVPTDIGAQYKLFWSFAARHDISAEQNHLSVVVDGSQVATNGPAIGNAPLAQNDWTKSNYTFTASSNSTEIAFEDIGPSNSYGTYLDDVRLCKIKNAEPSDNIPVITLVGSPIVNVDHSSVYTDAGATASDVEDGDITGDITTVNPVDTSTPGTYVITYNVSDSDGNNAVEVTRTVVVGAPYAPWCSVLFGALKDFYAQGSSASGEWNDVIDINNDEVVNLSDISLLSEMYYAGDNELCYAQFEDPTDEYHFQCEDPNVGWCGGLLQGVSDSINKPDRYFEVFDVYQGDELGVINLSDLSVISELMANNNQVDCYSYYVPPFFMCSDDKPYCGDGVVNQEIEQCDGGEPQSCVTESGYTGTKSCNMPSDEAKLQSVEQNYCVWNSCLTEEYCGDGIQNGNEQCDDGSNGSDTCSIQCETIPEPPCVTNCGGGGGGGGGGSSFSIKDLTSNISCQASNISWKTTRSSDTILELGTESGVYTQHIDEDDNTLNHTVSLKNLLPNTTYYYKIKAINGSRELTTVEKTFKTPPAEQCEEVLGEKIEGEEEIPLICDFLRPSGSHGEDADVHGRTEYADGSLLRDACDHKMSVYLIKDQKKWHVPNWQYLHDNYFGQRIYNVLTPVLDKFLDWGKVLGVKEYADGTLLRGPDFKIYVLENGHKKHIKNLEELAKYAGREIINVSDEVINRY